MTMMVGSTIITSQISQHIQIFHRILTTVEFSAQGQFQIQILPRPTMLPMKNRLGPIIHKLFMTLTPGMPTILQIEEKAAQGL